MAIEFFSPSPDSPKISGHTVYSDVWALAMVFYEILSGLRPYNSIPDAQIPTAICSGHLPQEPDFSDSANGATFHTLWSLAQKCWDQNPLSRPSASNILRNVSAILNTFGGNFQNCVFISLFTIGHF